ncbi:hypothetical protein LLH06_08225 [Mucilaginibacter daejeonensis]|uniref:hypothetical protein n=1 Tax=Mucilaginibacter daejeonensis TaxID=398049 RepID=UPI001D179917|nr:hypothetical protein [Mucilaginibacter daejeonensis]UEG54949.1 hypothetical protein LLH06_08225 [Mucilaginibacter daejeonensis]
MESFNGKRVILIVPFFFEYHIMLKKELEKAGAHVLLLENKLQKLDPLAVKSKILALRKLVYLFSDLKEKYVKESILPKIENQKFDYLIAINGFSITPSLVKALKVINPQIKTILYLWDTLAIFDWRKLFNEFDKVLTFDRNDSNNLNIDYLPNFYPANVENKNAISTNFAYDLFFIGTQHHDRYHLLKKIYEECKTDLNLCIKLLIKYKGALHNKLIYSIFKNLNSKISFVSNYVVNYELAEKKISFPFLMYKGMPYQEIEKLFNMSKAVLDIDLPYQAGYSHRLILALATGKKVITTNKWIANEKFFNPDVISIIDRSNPVIDTTWIHKKINETQGSSILNLRIDNWITQLVS